MRHRTLLLAAAVGFLCPPVCADVKLHPLFTDNMVLQRDQPIVIFGTCSPGEEVNVQLNGPAKNVATSLKPSGEKWALELGAMDAGTGYELVISTKNNTVTVKNVALGDVWICSGQSNMEWSVNASYDADRVKVAATNLNVRLFTVQKKTAITPVSDQEELRKYVSKWDVCSPETVGRFSAVGYHFGANLQKAANVPIGLIHTSWGGTPAEAWTSKEALDAEASLKYYTANAARAAENAGQRPIGPNTPSSLYNAMIHPLLQFPIKGAIWYQGESNAGRAFEYRTLFPIMIQDWRKRWGNEFPFLCVQLAPFIAGDADGVAYAELRDAQLHATKVLKDVGMAVITDAGDLFDIHPRDKATPGGRLAVAARAIAYGEKIAPGGPEFKEMKVDGNKAILSFSRADGGLVGRYGPRDSRATGAIDGFEVCGDDKYFYPAKAKIEGDTVVVTCEKVDKPVAARFGWKNYPVVNLYAKTNLLPASPFRTDDFPLTTQPKAAAKE